MTRWLPNFLLLLALPLGACGCTWQVRTEPESNRVEWEDATVALGVDIRDTAALWRVEADRPVLVVDVGPARAVRRRCGDPFFALGPAARFPMAGVSERPEAAMFVPGHSAEDDDLLAALFGVPSFIVPPLGLLPDFVATSLRESTGERRDAAAGFARYLLRTDPVPFAGLAGPRGRVWGWITLSDAGRKKLASALEAAGEPADAQTTAAP
jgi:hypothetical protein